MVSPGRTRKPPHPLRIKDVRFAARKGRDTYHANTYVVLSMNPEAVGFLQAVLYLFAERAANYPSQAENALALRDHIQDALRF